MLKIIPVFMLIFYGFNSSAETVKHTQAVSGAQIKRDATAFFERKGLLIDILVSDNRRYHPCSQSLTFEPRADGDWSSVVAQCEPDKWSVVLRTNFEGHKNKKNSKLENVGERVVVLKKNIHKNQIIGIEDIMLAKMPSKGLLGSYTKTDEVIGRKVRYNLVKGSILKNRHLEVSYDVNEGDRVLISSGNDRFSVTSYGNALGNGQIGEMIEISNSKSGKIIKVIIVGEKKVQPLTNM
jgi:flagella basal body P-ring formation protein FlgA